MSLPPVPRSVATVALTAGPVESSGLRGASVLAANCGPIEQRQAHRGRSRGKEWAGRGGLSAGRGSGPGCSGVEARGWRVGCAGGAGRKLGAEWLELEQFRMHRPRADQQPAENLLPGGTFWTPEQGGGVILTGTQCHINRQFSRWTYR
jgi:hypothetical protein